MMTTRTKHPATPVPIIDLAPARGDDPRDRAATARAIDAACRRVGFLVVVGHGVDPRLVTDMRAMTRRFFESPNPVKDRCAVRPGDVTRRGFHRNGTVAASIGVQTPPDLCESFGINRLGEPAAAAAAGLDRGDPLGLANRWPAEVDGFRPLWLRYLAAMERLADELLRLFALGLDLPETWFADKTDRHMTSLGANFYPAQHQPPAPGQMRKGPHTDWGSLTILDQDDAGGLQIHAPEDAWRDVPVVPGSFVVNIGDLMAIWTNDRWCSTLHRVVNPPAAAAGTARLSIAFFHQPNPDALVECLPTCREPGTAPRHPPVTSGTWFADKLRLAFG